MDELRKLLVNCGVTESLVDDVLENLGFSDMSDLIYIENEDQLKSAGVATLKARAKILQAVDQMKRGLENASEDSASSDSDLPTASLLAKPMDEDEWTRALEQQGILQFDVYTIAPGMNAFLASNIGMFDSVEKLADMINDYAIKNRKPSPLCFYTLQEILAFREFGAVFAANGPRSERYQVPIFATKKDVDNLMERIRRIFVPSVMQAAEKLTRWFNSLSDQAVSDYFTNASLGGSKTKIAYPSTSELLDAGKSMRLCINEAFAGNGIQKALAVTLEFQKFKEVLNDPALPQAIGATDRDDVLSRLGFDPNAAAIRSSKYIIQFILSFIDVEKLSEPNELQFFRELYGLSQQIDWSALTNNPADHNRFQRTTNPLINGRTPLYDNAIPTDSTRYRASIEANSQPQRLLQMNGAPVDEVEEVEEAY